MTDAAAPADLTWFIEVVERVPGTNRQGESCQHGRWRPLGEETLALETAMQRVRELRSQYGAARAIAPGFEVVARRDSFAVKRTRLAA